MRTSVVSLILLAAAVPTMPALAQSTMYGFISHTSPQLRQIDQTTGAIITSMPITGHEALFGGLACDSSGNLYSIDGYNDPLSDRTFRIDRHTGVGTVVGEIGFNWNFRMVHFHPVTGVLYAARDSHLFTIDTTTGLATPVAPITAPGLGQITALAINSQGQAYVSNIGGVNIFSVDLTTGAATDLGSVGNGGNWYADLAFDGDDVLWGVRNQGGVYTIDLVTLGETFQFPGAYKGLTFFIEQTTCYANCDGSTTEPILNVEDFTCFINEFASALQLPHEQQVAHYANCDQSTTAPALNVDDFTCFINSFAAGCP